VEGGRIDRADGDEAPLIRLLLLCVKRSGVLTGEAGETSGRAGRMSNGTGSTEDSVSAAVEGSVGFTVLELEEKEEDRAVDEDWADEDEDAIEGSGARDPVKATSIWFLPPMIPLREPSRRIPCTMGGRSQGMIRSPNSSQVL
jgi:hypothetical protein